jgi:hypothetical protein
MFTCGIKKNVLRYHITILLLYILCIEFLNFDQRLLNCFCWKPPFLVRSFYIFQRTHWIVTFSSRIVSSFHTQRLIRSETRQKTSEKLNYIGSHESWAHFFSKFDFFFYHNSECFHHVGRTTLNNSFPIHAYIHTSYLISSCFQFFGFVCYNENKIFFKKRCWIGIKE